ncbi:NF-X1-type zinc finger protein NFXL1-like, partial [Trifolium medium]|nr:NF-X1-type zinc finger protein NFXL1-like [Trifolium medium]
MSMQSRDRVPRRQEWVCKPPSTTDHLLLHQNEKGFMDFRDFDIHLPQLLQEIQDKLTKGTVECMICYDTVRRSAPIWSCSSCYSIFHLNCTNKWARAPTSSASTHNNNHWRCPGCQA